MDGLPEEVDAGRAAFRLRCSACHGFYAEGGRGPDLSRGQFSSGNSDEELFRVIADGVPGTEMPGFRGRNTHESIWRIIAYLRSLTPTAAEPPRGDPVRGEALYWGKGGCGACHQVGARGGRFGPELTRIGRSRSLKHLRESLLDPNADLVPGYNTVAVRTRDGKTITGVELAFDNFSAQLMDPDENIYSFLREEVQSIERKFESLMPSYQGVFSEEELDDLLAYLASLRGEEAGP